MARHTCHASGCERPVPPKMFMCASHWRRLPKAHQAAIWRHYRPGQEIDKGPSMEYRIVSHEAILAMARLDNRPAEEITKLLSTIGWLKGKVEYEDRANG